MILLDTSIVIEIVEERPAVSLCVENLRRFEPRNVHVSAITIFEVECGLFDGSPGIKRRRAMWNRFFHMLTYELVTDGVASAGARIVRETARKGYQLSKLDALIAATALEFDLVVATRDRDFDRVPGLKVEHWR